jgi:hypothetical protein
MNSIRVSGVMIIAFIFLMGIIVINVKKTEDSQISILIRIFTNYLQIMAASMSFNLKYPQVLTDIFYPVTRIGSTSETFLSFDCFIDDYELKGFTPSNEFFKLFLSLLLPIILFTIISLIWIILHFTK